MGSQKEVPSTYRKAMSRRCAHFRANAVELRILARTATPAQSRAFLEIAAFWDELAQDFATDDPKDLPPEESRDGDPAAP